MTRQPPRPPHNGRLFILTLIAVAVAVTLMLITPVIVPVTSSELHGVFDHLSEIATPSTGSESSPK